MKYSLIIPHYKSVEYLKRLLLTVPQRDDLEVIVVDDCSGREITQQIQRIIDSRKDLSIYSTSYNMGGGAARNVGLRYAKGEYIFFADSDDFFSPALNEILDYYRDESVADIVFFNALSLNSQTYKPAQRVGHLNNMFELSKTDNKTAVIRFRYLFGEPWCKLIKRTLIIKRRIEFDEIPIHNDTKFSYMCGHYAENIIIDDRTLYFVTERGNSVSKCINEKNLMTRQKVFSEKLLFLKNNNICVSEWSHDMYYFNAIEEAYSLKNYSLVGELLEISNKYGISKIELNRIKKRTYRAQKRYIYMNRINKIRRFIGI